MRSGTATKMPAKRLYILATVLLLWLVAILGRLVYLQIIKYDFFLNLASRQHGRTIDVDPHHHVKLVPLLSGPRHIVRQPS